MTYRLNDRNETKKAYIPKQVYHCTPAKTTPAAGLVYQRQNASGPLPAVSAIPSDSTDMGSVWQPDSTTATILYVIFCIAPKTPP